MDVDPEYYTWQHPSETLVIKLRHSVMEKIHAEVMVGFMAVPKRGAEVGGILLGSVKDEGRVVLVEDFEPVPCEHRFGPSYHFSPVDTGNLEDTLEWVRSDAPGNLVIVGFYRSHTRYGFFVGEEDEKLISNHFPDQSAAMLLIKPLRVQNSVADFFFRENGSLKEAGAPVRFPFGLPPLPPAPDVDPVQREAAAPSLPEPAKPELPPPFRHSPAFEAPARRRAPNWIWPVLTVVMAAAGGILGYESLGHGPVGAPRAAAAHVLPQASPLPPETGAPPAAAEPDHSSDQQTRSRIDTPALEAEEAPIRTFLSHWVNALKKGDSDAYIACYAPELSVYFTKKNVARSDVRQSVETMLNKYGRLDLYRLSDVQVGLDGPDRGHAVFRKRWQTAGRKKFAGEERERLGLIRAGGRWQIASEEELNLYWVHKAR